MISSFKNKVLILFLLIAMILVSSCSEQNIQSNKLNNVTNVKNISNSNYNVISNEINNTKEESKAKVKKDLLKNSSNTFNDDLLKEKYNKFDPVVSFSKDDIKKLNIDCSNLNPQETAECIYNWQIKNMIYIPTADDSEGPFSPSYELRWQELIPGVFNSRDVIETHKNHENKVYGVCWDFAVVYCSIAQYYNLTCRIIETKLNLNNETRPGGMSLNEYEAFKPWLLKRGYNYSYDAVRLSMPDDSKIAGHYWAEVKLDSSDKFNHDGWEIMDASNFKNNGRLNTLNYINQNKNWSVVDWTLKNKLELLNSYQERINNGEDLSRVSSGNKSDMDEFLEGREIYQDDVNSGNVEEYVGITDELGNTNRAKNIDDFMQGKALAPYMESCKDSCDFIMADDECKEDCVSLDESFRDCYDSCSGDKFYIVCDYICGDDDLSKFPNCYQACSGEELNVNCALKCED